MRISDWSSDVCSSDLGGRGGRPAAARLARRSGGADPAGLHEVDARGGSGAVRLHRDGGGQSHRAAAVGADRKSVVVGQRVTVSVDLGGRRNLKKNNNISYKQSPLNLHSIVERT